MNYCSMNNPSFRCLKLVFIIMLFQINSMLISCSLNYQGISLMKFKEKYPFGEIDHCSWFGIECVDGHLVSLHNGLPRYAILGHSRIMHSRKLLGINPTPPQPDQNLEFSLIHWPHFGKKPPPPLPPPPPPSSEVPASNTLPPVHPVQSSSNGRARMILIVCVAAAAGFSGLVLVIGIFWWRSNKIINVTPWATGLSGQLQKAFVTGIPNLKRSELESACEDFSNIVGSSSLGTIYKGTLSNGIEIAVISLPVTSVKDWSRSLEREFRNKIETLSKVNHKNFVNLIGYCQEKKRFARMLVFEYAPNGSLFEHLHVREAEHLDWGTRLRIAMGMAYCLEHMHQLSPPRSHPNFNSSSVNLSEDYAAKISDFYFWNEIAPKQMHPNGILGSLSASTVSPETNVFNFGLVLLEIMTGRIPLSSVNNNYNYDSIENWVSGYLREEKTLVELIDPMLRRFNVEQVESISEVIRDCLNFNAEERPVMKNVCFRLREITGIGRDKASPRLSPLWWAELELRSVNGE